jgi:type IX secretion system PorP/SprF family membrane protein
MRLIFTFVFLLVQVLVASAQYIPNSGQAFQFASVYNPAFSGIEDFTDLKFGYRQQMTSYGKNAPKFVNLIANFRLKQPFDVSANTLRPSNAKAVSRPGFAPAGKRMIIGAGVNVFNEKVGLIERLGGGLTYSMHYPLSKKVRLAAGITGLIEQINLDTEGIYLGSESDPDPFYEHLMQGSGKQTNLSLRGGMLLYSRNFYLGFSYLPITTKVLKKSEVNFSTPYYRGVAQAGVSMPLNADFVLKPSLLAVMQMDNSFLIDYSVKADVGDKTWFGLTYRDVKSAVIQVGFDFTSVIGAGYSYEMSLGEFKQFNDGSHDIVLSLRFNNLKSQRPYTW